jgi:L-xylulose reductase
LYDDGAIVYTLEKDPELIAQLKEELPRVTVLKVDLLDWKATKEAVTSLGPMDHLVNNAGVLVPQEFMDVTEEAANL